VTLAIIALFASAQGKFAVEHSALSFEAKKSNILIGAGAS